MTVLADDEHPRGCAPIRLHRFRASVCLHTLHTQLPAALLLLPEFHLGPLGANQRLKRRGCGAAKELSLFISPE
jgi:hypothetical protein